MKIQKIIFFILFFVIGGLFLFFKPAFAAVYYVSTSGDDAGAGSSGAPFKTIQKCANTANAGDTCHITAGTYYEKIKMNKSGSSGAPIVFEGEKSGDNWLTIIDGSVPLTGWTEDAATCGSGCFKATPNEKAFWLGVSDSSGLHDILRAPNAPDYPVDWMRTSQNDWLNHSANDLWWETQYQYTKVKYWDGFDAFWGGTGTWWYDGGGACPGGAGECAYQNGASPGNIWVKFRNGDDPSGKTIRYSGYNPVIDLTDASYVTVKNLKIQGADRQIYIKNAHDVRIENSELINGGAHISLRDSFNISILGNTIHRYGIDTTTYLPGNFGNWYGTTVVTATEGTPRYREGVKVKQYGYYKEQYYYEHAIRLDGNTLSHDIEIANNAFYDLTGEVIHIVDMYNVSIHDNTIHNVASCGLLFFHNYRNVKAFNNLIYNVNIGLRFMEMDMFGGQPRQAYIYNNRFFLSEGSGNQFYLHWTNQPPTPANNYEIYLYHNTFIGGYSGIAGLGSITPGVLTGFYWFNNILSVGNQNAGTDNLGYWLYSAADSLLSFGGFGYNWIGYDNGFGDTAMSNPWSGTTGVIIGETPMFSEASMPSDWSVPANHQEAMAAGIDVSKTFTVNGVTLGALPGFSPGYFSGSAPDIGAVQSGIVPSDTTPPSAPSGIMAQ